MDEREQWLANVELRGDGSVPCTVISRDAEDWHALAHAGGAPKRFEDAWGCAWLSTARSRRVPLLATAQTFLQSGQHLIPAAPLTWKN